MRLKVLLRRAVVSMVISRNQEYSIETERSRCFRDRFEQYLAGRNLGFCTDERRGLYHSLHAVFTLDCIIGRNIDSNNASPPATTSLPSI